MSKDWCILSLIVLLALCQSLAYAAGPLPATDIGQDPNQAGIVKVMNQRIMQGFPDGSFRPAGAVNEDAFAKVLERFLAVCPGAYDAAFVAKDRNQEVSRIRAITILLRYAASGTAIESVIDPMGKLAGFSDSSDVPAWALKQAAFAATNGLLQPAAQSIRPNETITRGELAGLIARAIDWTAANPESTGVSAMKKAAVYTGLVIDCRGLGLNRSMCPEIVCEESGRMYPDPKCAPSIDFVESNGLVAYAHELSQTRRAGSNPLVVVAIAVTGTASQAAVISEEDRETILTAEKSSGFLAKWNVVFLKD